MLLRKMLTLLGALPAYGLRGLIRLYQLTFSALIGRQCRHLPTCSAYALDAIARHGAWAGGWMALARLVRCRPGGSSGYDPAPERLPPGGHWLRPWRYGHWSEAQLLAASATSRASSRSFDASGSDSSDSK